MANSWPNDPNWCARREGPFQLGSRVVNLSIVRCGELVVPSGRLVVCDPFAAMRHSGNPEVSVAPGRFSVVVTLADVSEAQDGSHIREAYASLILSQDPESYRKPLVPLAPGQSLPAPADGEFYGFGVDAGTACFVDAACLEDAMPPERDWQELFDNGTPACWFSRMDDPAHIRDGIANIALPLGGKGENLVLFHSGWGDGEYPVIGGYSASGELLAVHIDFLVIPDHED